MQLQLTARTLVTDSYLVRISYILTLPYHITGLLPSENFKPLNVEMLKVRRIYNISASMLISNCTCKICCQLFAGNNVRIWIMLSIQQIVFMHRRSTEGSKLCQCFTAISLSVLMYMHCLSFYGFIQCSLARRIMFLSSPSMCLVSVWTLNTVNTIS